MLHVSRLVTSVEVDDAVADPSTLSVAASHEAVLSNGERVLLVEGRGWSVSGPADLWSSMSVDEIEKTARMVVGPDEVFDGYSQEDLQASHWAFLAAVLRRHGADVEGSALKEVPHDVVLGERLRARLSASSG